jgi:tricorn protease
VTAELEIDFEQDKQELFRQAWTFTADHFFDEKYNGANWDALRGVYAPLVAGARTKPELYRILNLMHGELNASHSGVGPAQSRAQSATAALGLRFDPAGLEKGSHVVSEVIPLGPAAIAGVQLGDTLTAVNEKKLEPGTALPEALQHLAGRRVELTLSRGGESRKLALQPVNPAAEKELLYRAWVESRRAYVDKQSGGKLGYVHLPDMSDRSLARLHLDLDADNHARQGVVVDVRNNNGGFVNAYALDVFTRKPYLTFLERGRSAVPARSSLGQRALELPTILVTNQHSLSDAEDFSEGYRRLKAGKIVGERTAGWIVYTWNQRLIDGSQLRMPRTKVFDNDGQLMEMHPRPVDLPVQRPVGESYSGKDSQLDVAIAELLRQLEADGPRPAPTSAGLH